MNADTYRLIEQGVDGPGRDAVWLWEEGLPPVCWGSGLDAPRAPPSAPLPPLSPPKPQEDFLKPHFLARFKLPRENHRLSALLSLPELKTKLLNAWTLPRAPQSAPLAGRPAFPSVIWESSHIQEGGGRERPGEGRTRGVRQLI